jgi:hypothetical protein
MHAGFILYCTQKYGTTVTSEILTIYVTTRKGLEKFLEFGRNLH